MYWNILYEFSVGIYIEVWKDLLAEEIAKKLGGWTKQTELEFESLQV